MIKAAKGILALAVIAVFVAFGCGAGVKTASAAGEEWAGCPAGSNTCSPAAPYATAEQACESAQGEYIPYFGYPVGQLLSMSAAPDGPDPYTGGDHPMMKCIYDSQPYQLTSTIYVEFECTDDQDVPTNGVCLPPGSPQDAEPLCKGNHGTDGDCPLVGDPVSISS